MFKSLCEFFNEYQEILINQYNDYLDIDTEAFKNDNFNKNDNKNKLIKHMLLNIKNDNLNNSIKYISAIRQICTLKE